MHMQQNKNCCWYSLNIEIIFTLIFELFLRKYSTNLSKVWTKIGIKFIIIRSIKGNGKEGSGLTIINIDHPYYSIPFEQYKFVFF